MIKFTCVVLIASATTLLGELPSSGVNAQTITIKQYQHPKNENDLTFNKAYLAGLKDEDWSPTIIPWKTNYFAYPECLHS